MSPKSKTQRRRAQSKAKEPVAPTEGGKGVARPSLLNICLGRGGMANNHSGNKAYRDIAVLYKFEYMDAEYRKDKGVVVREVMEHLKREGFRFVIKDKGDGLWYPAPEDKARAKVIQALREFAFDLRQEMEAPASPTNPFASRRPSAASAARRPSADSAARRISAFSTTNTSPASTNPPASPRPSTASTSRRLSSSSTATKKTSTTNTSPDGASVVSVDDASLDSASNHTSSTYDSLPLEWDIVPPSPENTQWDLDADMEPIPTTPSPEPTQWDLEPLPISHPNAAAPFGVDDTYLEYMLELFEV